MKREYETPKAEEFEVNYQENVTASDTNIKKGKNNPGCYKSNNGLENGCTVQY